MDGIKIRSDKSDEEKLMGKGTEYVREGEGENLVRRNDFILPIERRIQFPLQVAFNYCDFSNDLIS